ncbi:MAG: hypothetical protein AAF623_18250 [Planctomycetota bacterium]
MSSQNNTPNTTSANWCLISVDIPVAASVERTWEALIHETNQWWLPDFRCVAAESVVSIDTAPIGMGLHEVAGDEWLSWFQVQMYLPSKLQIHLVGNLAFNWGGPATSGLSLAVVNQDDKSVLQLREARFGRVEGSAMSTCQKDWGTLFTKGFQHYVESA